jgi:ligand-binding sensor domain-containing protein
MKKGILLLVMLTLTNLFAHAQTPEWVNYTNGEFVRAIVQEGNDLWIGTSGGLVKLDLLTGNKTHFEKSSSGLPDNYINAIVVDNDGNKWIATKQAGLVKFDNTVWTAYYPMGTNLPHDEITSLHFHSNSNTLWIGTFSNGLASYDGQNWAFYNTSTMQGAPSQINNVSSINVEQGGKIWIGCHAGLVGYDGTNWELFAKNITPGYPNGTVNGIQIDNQNNKWMVIGRHDDGALAKYDNTQMQFWTTTNSALPHHWVNSLEIDQNGLIWVSHMAGISTFDGTSFINHYNTGNTGLPVNGVNRVYIDSNDTKWFGVFHFYDGGGLISFDNTNWQTYNTSSSGLSHYRVFAFKKASTGDMWIGTNNALSKFDGSNWTHFNIHNSAIPYYTVTAIEEDAHGVLWIGTMGGGLASFDGVSIWTIYNSTTYPAMPSDIVYDIKIDQSGTKWIATTSGLATLDQNANWFVHDNTNGLPDNFVYSIALEQQGNTWVGTYNGGLAMRNSSGVWTIMDILNSNIPDNRIYSIAIQNNLVWVGTNNGLAVFTGSTFTTYKTGNSGLPNNVIQSVAVDASGELWLGTSGGLVHFDGASNWVDWNMFDSFLPSNWLSEVYIDNYGNKWIGTFDGGMSIYNQGGIVSVQENQSGNNPNALSNLQAYPNPFNSMITISYEIEEAGQVLIEITDIKGQLVDIILKENMTAGEYKTAWDASRHAGGIYFCTVQGKDFRQTKKLVLLNQ